MNKYDFQDIAGFSEWQKIKQIDKGWSDDKKYFVQTKNGDKLLLRLSDISSYEAKKKEYQIIQKYSSLGFSMSMPIEFGKCNQDKNVYMILSWVDGEDLEEILPFLTVKQQYLLGRQAGEILRRIHGMKVEETDMPTKTKVEKKLLQLERYENSNVRIVNDETVVQYVKDNIHKIWSKDIVYMHGDFHPGNLIYMENRSIGVIDFNRWEVGDPYEEFYKLESFSRDLSVPYSIGQIDAYFYDKVPNDFWEILAVYVAHASVHSIKWAEKFGQDDIDNMTRICLKAFEDYQNFERVVPVWYDGSMKEKYR